MPSQLLAIAYHFLHCTQFVGICKVNLRAGTGIRGDPDGQTDRRIHIGYKRIGIQCCDQTNQGFSVDTAEAILFQQLKFRFTGGILKKRVNREIQSAAESNNGTESGISGLSVH